MRRTVALLIVASLAFALFWGLPTGASFGSYGSQVAKGDSDFVLTYSDNTGADATEPVVCRATAGGALHTDHYYLHWGDSCSQVAAGDVRLTPVSHGGASFSAGTVVKAGDSDRDRASATSMGPFLPNVGYLETDGLPGYTPGDFLYFTPGGATLDATSGAIRLTTLNTVGLSTTAGTVVHTGSQAEITRINDGHATHQFPNNATLRGLGDFALRSYDAKGNGDFDPEDDPLYLVQDTSQPVPRIGDLRLSAVGGNTYGSKVSSGASDHTLVLDSLSAATARLVTTDAVMSPVQDRRLYIHFPDLDGGTDGRIQAGDVVIKGPSGAIGTRVTGTGTGQQESIVGSVDFASQVFFIDADGTGYYLPGSDPVYLNRPQTDFGGASDALGLSVGDVRLTSVTVGGSTYNAGTVVLSGHADLNAYSGHTPNAGIAGDWFLMHHNADMNDAVPLNTLTNGRVTGGGTSWVEDRDGAYIASSGTLSNNDRRLYASPTLANTRLSCGAAAHAECGGSVSHDPQIRTRSGTLTFTGTALPSLPVYYDADNSMAVSAGDYRLWHATLPIGEVQPGDTDIGDPLFNTTRLRINTTTSDPGANEFDVYYVGTLTHTDPLNLAGSHFRVHHQWTPPAPGSQLACSATPIDLDCGAQVRQDSRIKVTGGDGVYTVDRAEYVYHSQDSFVNEGDYRFLDVGVHSAGTRVAFGDDDTDRVRLGSNDAVYLNWCPDAVCSGTHLNQLLQVGDVRLAASNNRVTASTSGFKPTLVEIDDDADAQGMKRYPLGGTIHNDGFYLSFHDVANRLAVNDVRLAPFGTKAAGSLVESGDVQELGTTAVMRAGVPFVDLIKYVDLGSTGYYAPGDPVYVDLSSDLWTGANFGNLSSGDVRLTPVTVAGQSYAAGTVVRTPDTDRVNLDYASTQPDWTLYFFDADGNGAFSSGDTLYLSPGPAADSLTVGLNMIRLSGSAPAPTTPTTPPATTTPTTPTETTPTETTPTETTPTTTPPVDDTPAKVAAGNAALADSLAVTVEAEAHLLSWSAVPEAAGYQVWQQVGEGNWSKIADPDASATGIVVSGAQSGTRYIVTVWMLDNDDEPVGQLTDINTETVTGNEELRSTEVPDGVDPTPTLTTPPETTPPDDSTPTPTEGETLPTPAAGVVALLAMLALALVAARRKR